MINLVSWFSGSVIFKLPTLFSKPFILNLFPYPLHCSLVNQLFILVTQLITFDTLLLVTSCTSLVVISRTSPLAVMAQRRQDHIIRIGDYDIAFQDLPNGPYYCICGATHALKGNRDRHIAGDIRAKRNPCETALGYLQRMLDDDVEAFTGPHFRATSRTMITPRVRINFTVSSWGF